MGGSNHGFQLGSETSITLISYNVSSLIAFIFHIMLIYIGNHHCKKSFNKTLFTFTTTSKLAACVWISGAITFSSTFFQSNMIIPYPPKYLKFTCNLYHWLSFFGFYSGNLSTQLAFLSCLKDTFENKTFLIRVLIIEIFIYS